MYYYANRADRNGNQLLTSYANEKSAVKYGGADSEITNTEYRAEFSDDFVRMRIAEDASGPVVRSFMKNINPVGETGGRFVLWGKADGVWGKTPFSFSSYGAANTTMKAMISLYEAMVVLDDGDESVKREPGTPMSFDNL